MNLTNTPQPLIELEADRFEPGYWRGMRQPAVQTTLLLTRLEVAAQAVRGFDALMAAVIAQPVLDSSRRLLDETVAQHPVLSRVMTLALAVLDTMGMPVLGGTTAVKPDPEGAPRQWLVGLPAVAASIRAPQAALGLACRVMNRFAANEQFSNKALEAEITILVNRYRLLAPSGVNTLRFLNAAHELGIPWRHVAKNVYQFGWGSRSRWLDSSFTDETSVISANLARDKVASATVLRDAGLPVPRHQLVNSAEEAVAVAEAMGYPVVVKSAKLGLLRLISMLIHNGSSPENELNLMRQDSFFDAGSEKHRKKTRKEQFLEEMETIIPWKELTAAIEPFYPKPEGAVLRPIGIELNLRISFIQHLFNLLDPSAEKELFDSRSLRYFVGIDLGREPVTDEASICEFRYLMEKHNLGDQPLYVVNQYLQENGLKVSRGAIVDASNISAPSSTKNKKKERDPKIRRARKCNQWYFGMKAHIGIDSKTRLIHSVDATSANVHDSQVLPDLLHREKTRVWSDSANFNRLIR